MNNEEILEGNKLIAQFMDVKNVVEFRMKKNPEIIDLVIAEDEDGYIDYVEGINYILYHSDWNQLMSVVEKIENLEPENRIKYRVTHMYSIDITGNGTTIKPSTGKDFFIRYNLYNERLLCTWNCVVKFIKWYNKTNEQ